MQLRRLERVDQAYGLESARQLLSEKRLQDRSRAGIARAPTDSRHAHDLAVLAKEASQRAANIDVDPIRWPDHTTMAAPGRAYVEAG